VSLKCNRKYDGNQSEANYITILILNMDHISTIQTKQMFSTSTPYHSFYFLKNYLFDPWVYNSTKLIHLSIKNFFKIHGVSYLSKIVHIISHLIKIIWKKYIYSPQTTIQLSMYFLNYQLCQCFP
jgi:hypothetical protein